MRKTRVTKHCETCGKPFEVKVSHVPLEFCCSRKCGDIRRSRKRQIEIEQQFGKPIKQLLEHLYYTERLGIKQISKRIGVSDRNLWDWFDELGIDRRSKSDAVANQWRDNPERREKQGNWLRDVMTVFYGNGGKPPLKRPELAAKISEARKGEGNPMWGKFGPLNPLWRGGKITDYGPEWWGIRKQIVRRDGYKCRRCGTSENLHVHHIVKYRISRDNSFENLVTLCATCHILVEDHGATWY